MNNKFIINGVFVVIVGLIINISGCAKSSNKVQNNYENTNIKEIIEDEDSISEETIPTIDDFEYINYCNSEYGYSIEYPSFLINESESKSNDGIVLSNSDNSVRLNIWSSQNNGEVTVESKYNESLSYLENVVFTALDEKFYIITGEGEEKVYYKYEVVGSETSNAFMITYNKVDERILGKVINHLKNSFST